MRREGFGKVVSDTFSSWGGGSVYSGGVPGRPAGHLPP